MKNIIYIPVKIESEKDLPSSERAWYFVGVKDNLNPEDIYEWFNYKNPVMAQNQVEIWLNTFDYWLKPVEVPDEEKIDKRFGINVSMIRPCNLSTRNKWIQQGIMWFKSQIK